MPMAPGKPCRSKTCSNVTSNKNGYCDECIAAGKRPYEDRLSSRDRGYDSRWDIVSRDYKRKHPLCEDCLQNGLTTVTEMVHHIIPLHNGGELLDESNLRSLCLKCHGKYP
jgi:5-methylcytosine-specific restriction enzyme A